MVLESEFPPDERVEKEAKTLISEGFEVYLFCYTKRKSKLLEDYHGIKIFRFYLNNKLKNKLTALHLILPFYGIVLGRKIKKIIIENDIDIIHVHDLPFCNIGVRLKKKCNLKLVCDQHEFYSNWIVNTAHYNTFLGKIVKLLSNWKKFERKNLKQADLVITVEEPLRQIYIKKVGIKPNKIINVPNTPSSDIFNEDNLQKDIIRKYKDNFVIFYAGGIDRLRGIDLVINSLKEMSKYIPEIKFVLAGNIFKGFDPIGFGKKNNVSKYMEYIGFVPLSKLPSYIFASDICIFTPPANRDEINKTIATKIYQYISMGKPVIVSQVKMMKEFVQNNNVGFVVNNSKEFAEVIFRYYKDKNLQKKLSLNCKRTSDKYKWEKTVDDLIRFYHKI